METAKGEETKTNKIRQKSRQRAKNSLSYIDLYSFVCYN